MGMRFRKSVKICKGVRVNFSKSGASLSLGGQGHSLNVGGRGARATVGIPGTGLSYSKSLTSGHRSKSSRGYHNSTSANRETGAAVPSQVQLVMNAEGRVEIRDKNGALITDQSVIRKIKATDSYKNMVRNLETQRQEKLDEIYNNSIDDNSKFIDIYKMSPQVDNEEQYINILNSLRPPVYVKKEFEIIYPTEEHIRNILIAEARENVKGNIFNVGKLRREYVTANLQNRLNTAIADWEQKKSQFDMEEAANEVSQNERFNTEFIANKQYLINLINGEDEEVTNTVESWISSCELPVEIDVDYDWHKAAHIMYLDVDLPEIEDIPNQEIVRLTSGNLKEKKKSQATLKQEYVNLVFGLAIFISANVFNASPSIKGITISGYTQRRNKDGDINDEYVYSIKFVRDIFESSILKNVDPRDFCMRFENRCNITSSMLMKKIEPYAAEDGYASTDSRPVNKTALYIENNVQASDYISNEIVENSITDIKSREQLIMQSFANSLEQNNLAISYKTKRLNDGSLEVSYKGRVLGAINVENNNHYITYQMGNSGKYKQFDGEDNELAENTAKWIRYILNYI
ncbi:DUF4236 domain-containing protein [Pseudobutyrivibrio ruminis]|uniref:DUF4236 domain-containing protein n=1 Tax=Pseudobutyrivibrio ruminis TaxID=46206 RepID=UPI00068B8044|nr:DUF4236 domain-containing protein [Pseudobutyrivibrio ruminis]